MNTINKKDIKKLHRYMKKNQLGPVGTVIGIILLATMVFSYATREGHLVDGVYLQKCVDGDTAHFHIDGSLEKVRFIAVDTPEITSSDYYAKQAKDYTCGRLQEAEKIEIKIDPLAKEPDKYGRLIAWVYVDGELLQKELVEQGYASVKYIYDDYLYVDQLRQLEHQAKVNKIGIWKKQ